MCSYQSFREAIPPSVAIARMKEAEQKKKEHEIKRHKDMDFLEDYVR